MNQTSRIAIVGGGMSGLAAALALLKRGFNVEIYEQAEALHTQGIGLTLTPNGLKSLEAIQPGIGNLLRQAGTELHRLVLKHHSGEMIESSSISEDDGQPLLNIQGSRLHAILASALPSNAIQFQHRCVGYERLEDGVKLFFANGKTVETDVLIGADGTNSVVRQTLLGDRFSSFNDRISWQAVIPFEHPQLSSNSSLMFTAPDSKIFLLFPVGEGCAAWSASARSTNVFVSQRATTPKNCVLKQFIDWAEPVSTIVAETSEEAIVESSLCSSFGVALSGNCDPLQQWSEGRVMLLGDAAHPLLLSLEQGVNLAFENANELAACLANPSTIADRYIASLISKR